ncbi:four helix bundle protein [Candidatus Parcubacteria bacterium]|nr:four helix bundle protein [Candidatus Parcubacteria bacterium]
MPNQVQNPKPQKIYDLEERTAVFGENIVEFCKSLPQNNVTTPLLRQVIRSGTSIGANYCEADGAESGKDFKHKIAICKKESKETKHWLRMIAKAIPEKAEKCRNLWKEAQELTLIFSSIIKSNKTKIEQENAYIKSNGDTDIKAIDKLLQKNSKK